MRVLDLFSAARDRSADSASDPVAHDMSDKVSRPCRASCSPLISTRRSGDAQVCAQHPAPVFHRTTDTLAAHLDDAGRSELGCRPGLALLRRERSRSLFDQGSVRRTLTCCHVRSARSTQASNASGSRLHETLFRSARRTVCNAAESVPQPSSAASETSSRTQQSTTSQLRDQAQTWRRKSRSVSGVWS